MNKALFLTILLLTSINCHGSTAKKQDVNNNFCKQVESSNVPGVVGNIMSYLTTKEKAKLNRISKFWNNNWNNFFKYSGQGKFDIRITNRMLEMKESSVKYSPADTIEKIIDLGLYNEPKVSENYESLVKFLKKFNGKRQRFHLIFGNCSGEKLSVKHLELLRNCTSIYKITINDTRRLKENWTEYFPESTECLILKNRYRKLQCMKLEKMNMPNLTHLELTGYKNVNLLLARDTSCIKKLKSLELRRCSINAELLTAIKADAQSLEKLFVYTNFNKYSELKEFFRVLQNNGIKVSVKTYKSKHWGGI